MKIAHGIFAALLTGWLAACGTSAPKQIAVLEPGDESGIGGTGILARESGIGGTGIVGEITGFGSIFVNGAEVETDRDTRIRVDGEAVSTHAFAVGEVVALHAVPRKGGLFADEAHVRHEVIGPVTGVNEDIFTVLGQRVRFAGPRPAVGERVAVSGFRDPAGVIHATRIAPAPTGEVLVVGVPKARPSGWRLGDLALRLPGEPPVGEVRLRGRLEGQTLRVRVMQPVSLLPFDGSIGRAVIQGFVRPLGDGRLGIDGLRFAAAGVGQLPTDRPVRLELHRQAGGWRLDRLLPSNRLPLGRPSPVPRAGMPRSGRPVGRPPVPGGSGMSPGMYRR